MLATVVALLAVMLSAGCAAETAARAPGGAPAVSSPARSAVVPVAPATPAPVTGAPAPPAPATVTPAPSTAPAAPPPTPPPAPATVAPPPAPAETALARGRALLARGEAAAALPPLREAARTEPERLEARTSLALALQVLGDLDGAIEECRAVLRQDPERMPARLQLASALMARHDWAGARAELDEAVRRRPDLLQAHLGLGLVRYTLGDLDGAIAAYRRALALDPSHADARLSLALTLKLARREAEAARELAAAAEAGLPRAQYFLGAGLATGAGGPRDLAGAVRWWVRAAEGGVPQAEEALAQLRQVALGRGRQGPVERRATEQAFRDYRASLWGDFPDVARDGGEDSVGAALLRGGRAAEALAALLREAAALGEPAQQRLEALYETGIPGQLAPYDARILAWVRAAAAEGQRLPRLTLARIYARGLGVPRDVPRAQALLRATPHEDAQRLLQELTP